MTMIKSEFFKNASVLLSSNVIAQVIALAIYPLLTRLYSPEDFGEFSLFLTITSFLTILSTCRYEYAIVLPKEEKKALALLNLCVRINILLFVVLMLVSFFFKEAVAILFQSKVLKIWLPLIPVLVLVSGLWQAWSYYLTRLKRFKKIALYNVSQSAFNTSLKYGLGVFGYTNAGLVFATIIGQSIALLLNLFSSCNTMKSVLSVETDAVRNVAKEYNNFLKFELPHAAINFFSSSLPIVLLTPFFDLTLIGFFSLCITIGFRPINVFCNSMYQVLYQKVVMLVSNGESISGVLKKYVSKILISVLLPFVLVFVFASPIFEFLFGSEWKLASNYFKPLMPWFFVIIFASSLSFLPKVFSKQKQAMYIEIIYVLLRLAALVFGIIESSFYLAIVLFSIASVIVLIGQLLWFASLIRNYEKELCV